MERVTEAAVRRQRTIQTTLLLIILATLPCYCVGFVLLGIAPNRQAGTPTLQGAVTATSSGEAVSSTPIPPTITLISGSGSTLSPLLPTPTQFRFIASRTPLPPTFTSIPPTSIPTIIILPTNTPVPPTRTPQPPTHTPAPPTKTNTPEPPTNTSEPPTNTSAPATNTNTSEPPTATLTLTPDGASASGASGGAATP